VADFSHPRIPISQKKENADDKIAIKTQMEADIVESGKASDALEAERDKKLKLIGNLVHDSVPVSKNEVRPRLSLLPLSLFSTRLYAARLSLPQTDSFQVSGRRRPRSALD
jgi:hypothetical protein